MGMVVSGVRVAVAAVGILGSSQLRGCVFSSLGVEVFDLGFAEDAVLKFGKPLNVEKGYCQRHWREGGRCLHPCVACG